MGGLPTGGRLGGHTPRTMKAGSTHPTECFLIYKLKINS